MTCTTLQMRKCTLILLGRSHHYDMHDTPHVVDLVPRAILSDSTHYRIDLHVITHYWHTVMRSVVFTSWTHFVGEFSRVFSPLCLDERDYLTVWNLIFMTVGCVYISSASRTHVRTSIESLLIPLVPWTSIALELFALDIHELFGRIMEHLHLIMTSIILFWFEKEVFWVHVQK